MACWHILNQSFIANLISKNGFVGSRVADIYMRGEL